MRPPRIIIVAAFCVTTLLLTFTSLRPSHSSRVVTTTAQASSTTGVKSFFSFHTPFSLFPPNAIITLVHDNTTAFLARPAAFGPSLPARGLKGQVWIGSGFGDDGLRQGSVNVGAEGELGCSDVPGWVDSFSAAGTAKLRLEKGSAGAAAKPKSQKRSSDDGPFDKGNSDKDVVDQDPDLDMDDGTDDYLHHPLQGSSLAGLKDQQSGDSRGDHADIQSIQEGAEIAGKIVLLSRGGCGFLEKAKWAQRRGAIALMVGDNTKGGPLIQMYARGDTSNIGIPAIFTSRTTAHLLSSLIGTGTFIQDAADDDGKPRSRSKQIEKPARKAKKCRSEPTFTRATGTKPTMMARSQSNAQRVQKKPEKPSLNTKRPGWFRSLFGASEGSSKSDSSRPPSSGQLDWVLADDWEDKKGSSNKKASTGNSEVGSGSGEKTHPKGSSKPSAGDDFVIGVHDWRDPDLVGSKESENGRTSEGSPDGAPGAARVNRVPLSPTKAGKKHLGGALQEIPEYVPALRGGSITPGSGEYGTKGSSVEEEPKPKGDQNESTSKGKSKGILTTIFGDDEEEFESSSDVPSNRHEYTDQDGNGGCEENEEEYDGLWVTLMPTSGATPFLDTLLVLVVSPLVTLTIVYALLLVRSRIRRRRWRAPKSVVERLPVRTYQTVASSGSQSPRLANPMSNSPLTPLLQQSPTSRPRPRSRTTSGIPEPGDIARVNSQPLQVPTMPFRIQEESTPNSVSSEWKKYMGKQVECVVCLEEYIDGVSRVMSLPCGHEFHADCITPWLTTRRRTCPICKGDVVRSLARGSPSSPRYEGYHDDDSDFDTPAVPTTTTNSFTPSVNPSPTPAMPISRGGVVAEDDLEQGTPSPRTGRPGRARRMGSWRSLLASSLGSTGRSPRSQQTREQRERGEEDRTR